MKSATYFTGYESWELEVIKTNPDKTVDLGSNGETKVSNCPISDTEQVGHCVLEKPSK